jgi:hypothetical protein
MRKAKVWRYYCDHCRKGGCSAGAMKTHEARCLRNPKRSCGFCAIAGEAQEDVDVLVEAFHGGDIDRLRTAAHGCPACMLAAVLEWRKRGGPGMPEEDGMYVPWSYEEEKAAFWKVENEFRQAEEYNRCGGAY